MGWCGKNFLKGIAHIDVFGEIGGVESGMRSVGKILGAGAKILLGIRKRRLREGVRGEWIC